jgi:hypothetical protein
MVELPVTPAPPIAGTAEPPPLGPVYPERSPQSFVSSQGKGALPDGRIHEVGTKRTAIAKMVDAAQISPDSRLSPTI